MSVKSEIEKFYLSSSHSHALFVYRYLNEALATALGNGWYGEILNGKISDEAWYSVGYIDGLAKAYFPLVKKYLKRKKGIDRNFFKETLRLAKSKFPRAPFSIDANFIALKVLSNHNLISAQNISNKLRSSFRVQSMERSSPIRESDWDEIFNNGKSNTFLVTHKSQETLKRLGKHLKKNHQGQLAANKNFLAIIYFKNRYLFWVNVADEENMANALKILKAKTELSTDFEMVEL